MLFDKPLYQLLRPKKFSEFSGINSALKITRPNNLIIWGPPGVGKTTLANIYIKEWRIPSYELSAVLSGKNDIKKILEIVEKEKQSVVLFIDEIHAFNRAQQNIFLKHIELGQIIFLGATTENPSFEIIPPLLSRCRLIKLEKLSEESLTTILKNALKFLEQENIKLTFYEDFFKDLSLYSNGDARVLLTILERVVEYVLSKGENYIDKEAFAIVIDDKILYYDKAYEEHYNLLSAYHKSLRGSDPDAALYWLFRMLEAGEKPEVILRRLISAASEDVGNADPQALVIAISAKQAYEFLGRPEGDLALAQATIYIATAPKSNSVYQSIKNVKNEIKKSRDLPVPIHLRNAVTKIMRDLGYGKDYKYPHNYPNAFVKQDYLPEKIKDKKFYSPNNVGFEREIVKRLKWWESLKKENDNI